MKAGPNIGDLAGKGLPYAVEELASERDRIRIALLDVKAAVEETHPVAAGILTRALRVRS